MRRIVVIGAGMAAARFAERFTALAPAGSAEVTLLGDEPSGPYNRALLADVLTGRYAPGAVRLPVGGAAVRTGCEVTGVDVAGRVVRAADGSVTPYDELVLATGAVPVLPPVRNLLTGPVAAGGGRLKAGVHAFRTLADCARLAEDVPRAGRAVVIGGGVLGVSAARALAAAGVPVEIVHQAPHLMERHLDAGAARVLTRALRGMGVEVYAENRARALAGGERVEAVDLANGFRLEADLVVLACGVRPRTGVARAAGLAVRTGVVVGADLAASAPGVYAIGDCAEAGGVTHGLSGPAWEQADVLAARLSGADPGARYTASRTGLRLTAGTLEVAAFGEPGVDAGDGGAGTDVVRIEDATRGTYKKLVMRGDRLVGGVLVGDVASVGAMADAYDRDEPLPADPLPLLTV